MEQKGGKEETKEEMACHSYNSGVQALGSAKCLETILLF